MATLTVQTLPANGGELAVTFAAADVGGDEFTNTGRELLAVQWGASRANAGRASGVSFRSRH